LATPLEILRRKFTAKTLLILFLTGSIISLFLPGFSWAQEEPATIEAPKTIEEIIAWGKSFFQKIREQLPQIVEKIWKEEVLPVWKKMYETWLSWWNSFIKIRFQNLWQKFTTLIREEIEKRKPQIEKEFQEEKEELKEEVQESKKSFWDKLKELIK